jgi:predicted ATPase/DNA-binding winged helix-turn-helix (wHTH) protein
MTIAAEDMAFGPFRLSVRQRMLSDASGPVSLSSRAFDVLLTLIEARAGVVSKDDLMRRVWGNIVVEENNLHVQIAAIRRALGAGNRFIVTVPGRGYRFVGDLTAPAEAAAFAPPAAAAPSGAPATNLPSRMTALIGRRQDLATVCALFDAARLVTLVGPGGVGKTKLALEAARTLLPRFPDGCWMVELGAIADPALVPSIVAATLRIEEIPGKPVVESLAGVLRQRETLLLLEGCEHLVQAVADLAGLLLRRCPRLGILATSQIPLGVEGEQIHRVAPFALPAPGQVTTAQAALELDAVRLFAERAGAAGGGALVTDATAASVVEICRSLDGIPLAIELAAARAPLLGLEPVRSRIANRLALLGDERRDTPDRHRTLRAAIAWSYGLLLEHDRQILRRLGVFSGGFTLAAAQVVAAGAGFSEWDVLRGVGVLVQRSLLTTGPDLVRPRHRMLEAMRDFAHEQLAEAGEHAAAARRHAQYFLDQAEAAEAVWETSADIDWLAPFTPELENFRAALGWALAPGGDPLLGARLAAATARYWFEAGLFTEGRGWLLRAIQSAPPEIEPGALARLKRGLADLSMDAAAAVIAAREASALAARADDPAEEGVCLRALSAALYRLGRYDEAEQTARAAFERLRASDRLRTLAVCVSDLCLLRGAAGDYAEARRFNIEAQARLKALGDARRSAKCLQYAAEFEFAAGHVQAAIQLAEESVALFRALGSRAYLEVGLGNLAAYRLAMDDADGAGEAAREALVIAREIEDQAGVVFALEYVALAAVGQGAADAAGRLHGYVEEAHAVLGLERQTTEQAVHERLLRALARALPPDRLTRLAAEGRLMHATAAAALALEASRAMSPEASVAFN